MVIKKIQFSCVLSNKNIYNVVFSFLILFIFLSGQIEHQFIWHIIIVISYGILFLFGAKNKKRKKDIWIVILLCCTIILFFLSSIVSANQDSLFFNIRSPLYSLCSVGLLYSMTKIDSDFLLNHFLGNIWLYNAFLVLNIFVLYLQALGTGAFIKPSWLSQNPFYPDQCSGLFGFNATYVLGLYSIFVMILNLAYIKKFILKTSVIYLITVLSQGAMVILSRYNDNIGYYILLAVFLLIYVYLSTQSNQKLMIRTISYVKYMIIFLILLWIIFSIPEMKEYFNSTVINRIQRLFSIGKYKHASGYGSNERTAIVKYAFTKPTTWNFGIGLGGSKLIESGGFGFAHFGISSMGSYLVVAGFWFYIVYAMLYARVYFGIVGIYKGKEVIVLKCVSLLIVVLLTLYTTIFNDARTAILVGFIFSLFRSIIKENRKSNNAKRKLFKMDDFKEYYRRVLQ